MSQYDFDLITIGGGSGGVRASRIAAGLGAKVAVVEEDRLGGTCVLRGCVPKKLLVYGASFAGDFADAEGFGWTLDGARHDWGKLMQVKRTELDRLAGVYQGLLDDAGVEVLQGRGVLVDAHSVEVAGKIWTAERILLAVGGAPYFPDIEGLAEHGITSNEALDLDARPEEIVILGGGYIAVELAGVFAGFGTKTHLVFRADKVLRGFDETMREGLMQALENRGIILHPNATPTKIDAKQVVLDNGTTLSADAVLGALGRRPNTAGLGLEKAGIALAKNGAIVVDALGQTNQPSIFAIGDVTDRVNLTPVAIAEGQRFAERIYGGKSRDALNYGQIASAVFSQPPLASIGCTEADAIKAGEAVEIYESAFRPMKNTISGRTEKSMLKLIMRQSDGRIIGAHMLGTDAPEIIQGIAIAMTAGATKTDFDATIGIHPTTAEEFVTMQNSGRNSGGDSR